MSTITDPELDLRLGVLDPVETARVERYATAAFLWRRVSQDDAQCRRVPVVAQPGVDDFRRLGRRISRAVNLLDTARTIV